jgi:O-antigen ligase
LTYRHRLLLAGGTLGLPAVVAPLLLRPTLAIAFVCAVAGVVLAARGVAYPLALAPVFSVVVGLLGHNPFPPGAIAKITFAWVAIAILLAVMREDDALPARVLMTAPVILTVATAFWMLARLGSSSDPAYGGMKLQLFVAQNVAFLIAGIAVARRPRELRTFLVLTLGMAGVSTIVLANELLNGRAQAGVGGRFALSSDYNPILFGRDAARAMTIAVFFLLITRVAWLRLVSIALLPLLAVSFTAAGSRGPAVGLVLGLLALFALTLRDPAARRRITLVFAAGIAGAVLVVQLVPGQNVSRTLFFLLGSPGDASSNGRSALWGTAWHAFTSHPLFGVGTGSFAGVDPLNLYPHNLLLEMLAELGIVGGLLVLGTIVLGASRLVGTWRTAGQQDRLDAAVVASLLVAAFANAMFSGDVTTNSAVWLALGLALGLRVRTDAVPALEARVATTVALARRRTRDRGDARPQVVARPSVPETGAIISPVAGETVTGPVRIVVQPARTGRPLDQVRLEVDEAGTWVPRASRRPSWSAASQVAMTWRPDRPGVRRLRAVTVQEDGMETATAPLTVSVEA